MLKKKKGRISGNGPVGLSELDLPEQSQQRATSWPAAALDQTLRAVVAPEVIEHLPTESLRPNLRNARRHSPKQIGQLKASIQAFGFITPVLIDEAEGVLAGHGRLAAAKQLGLEKVPCIRVEHLNQQAKRAFALADNRLAELSDWDEELLRIELQELEAALPDLNFELEVTGFDMVEFDRLLGPEPDPSGRQTSDGLADNPDDQLPVLAREVVSRPGDLWCLGRHRVLCGDALEAESYESLLGGEQATQVFSDPPYNVRISKHVTAAAGFREFAMASGELSAREFTNFLIRALRQMRQSVVDGAILHICMDWRHMDELSEAARSVGLALKNLCVWTKPAAGMGSFYRSQHEFVFVFKAGAAPHINTFGLGARGRSRSNVWRYPGVIGPRKGVNDPDGGHPTVKPTSLVIDAIRDCSHRGDIVLDPFGGSGTTLIAAERTGRRARLIELDPAYVDLIVRRWQVVTGGTARLEADGPTFEEVQAERGSAETDRTEDLAQSTAPALAAEGDLP